MIVRKSPIVLMIVMLAMAFCQAAAHVDHQYKEDTVERKYDVLYQLQLKSLSLSPNRSRFVFRSTYHKCFDSLQSAQALLHTKPNDLKLLYQASTLASLYSDDSTMAIDGMHDIEQLSKWKLASTFELTDAYLNLFAARLFRIAADFAKRNHLDVERFPAYQDETSGSHHLPTELVVSRDMASLRRLTVNLQDGPKLFIVSSPFCHFCQRAIRDIEHDARLRAVVRKSATWLVVPSQQDTLSSVNAWNRLYPKEHMALAYREREWPMFDDWSTPIFYIFSNGILVKQISGWPAAGRRSELLATFKRYRFS